jgi:hypothetical protein
MGEEIGQRKSFSISLHLAYKIFLSFTVSVVFLLSTGCTNRNKNANTVDRNDPESVLRAYFEAWDRKDWSFQASLMMGERKPTPDEVESVRLFELHLISDSSSPDRTYQVSFEIKLKKPGSMNSGQYSWTYTLSWDANRGSWLITNYGAG